MVKLSSFLLPLLGLVNLIQPKVLTFDWKIEERAIAPDNYLINGILIDGQFPGPTINAVQGDIIKVKVRNLLHKEFTIHWHGIIQKGTSLSDGVPYVTQDPILPGGVYDYYFELGDQSGTHWYHAHTGLDAEHAYGAIIIKDKPEVIKDINIYNPKYKYDEEHVVMISELWHKSLEEIIEGLTGPELDFISSSDSILINGQVYKNWPDGNADPTLPTNKGNAVFKVKPNTTYRLRLIGALGLEKMKFSMDNHTFTLIEADGTLLEPFDVPYVEIFGGQRYSVLFKTNQKPGNYIAYAQRTGERDVSFASKAIFHYENGPDYTPMIRAELTDPVPAGQYNRWVEKQLSTSLWNSVSKRKHWYPPPKKVTKTIMLKSSVQFTGRHADEVVNGKKLEKRNTTLLTDVINGSYKPGNNIFEINEGDAVQIVMEQEINADRFPGCQHHPWHLHGHSFHVVGSGQDEFDPIIDNKKIGDYLKTTTKLPLFRDTFNHFPENVENTARVRIPNFYDKLRDGMQKTRDEKPRGSPTYCGWYAIRFIADNPGAWFMHCHISAHLLMGKQIMIYEKPKDKVAFVNSINARKAQINLN